MFLHQQQIHYSMNEQRGRFSVERTLKYFNMNQNNNVTIMKNNFGEFSNIKNEFAGEFT